MAHGWNETDQLKNLGGGLVLNILQVPFVFKWSLFVLSFSYRSPLPLCPVHGWDANVLWAGKLLLRQVPPRVPAPWPAGLQPQNWQLPHCFFCTSAGKLQVSHRRRVSETGGGYRTYCVWTAFHQHQVCWHTQQANITVSELYHSHLTLSSCKMSKNGFKLTSGQQRK